MITPEEHNKDEENKKTVYKETTTEESEELTNGETSSNSGTGTTAFSNTPERKNKPLGSGHEPGVTPGRDF